VKPLSETGLFGIVTVLNTPFNNEGKPDIKALATHVKYAIKSGVSGFLVPAMASEVDYLSQEERYSIVTTVLETCNGKVPVIGGASAYPENQASITKTLIKLGCEGVLVSIPFTYEDSYRKVIGDVADTGVDYLMIQDWDPKGFGLPVDFIVKLHSEIPAFSCLKIEVVPAGAKYTQVKEATAGDLQVAGGWAVMHLIDGLDRGVDIFMPTGLHEIYIEIFHRYKKGDREKAIELFRKLLPILTFSNQHLDISICFFKKLLYRQGIYSTDKVRCSTRLWDSFNRNQANLLIDEALSLINTLK